MTKSGRTIIELPPFISLAVSIVVALLCACTHAIFSPGSPDDLEQQIRLSKASDRDVWWPAVEELGKMANSNETLRNKIWAQARVNTLGMKLALVKPGTFLMGPDKHRVANIQVEHPVRISRPYFISVTEVTNAQFQMVFPKSKADARFSPDADSPVVNVLWQDADELCRLLSEREGAQYRLPTEAEWEYASRAGRRTQWCFGRFRFRLDEFGWCDAEEMKKAARVALLKPNDWGIYDMHGNVLEWVSDWYSDEYYAQCAAEGTVQDPKGPLQGRVHVVRSGCWAARNPVACSSTARFPLPILDRKPFSGKVAGFRQTLGFRIVREFEEAELAASD